ncbi:MAG: hypothetical protein ACR2F9_07815 [Longimicrobiaceae bacterium]
MALFVLLGMPLVGYVWETLNRLLAGHFDPLRLAVSVPLLVLLVVLLRVLAALDFTGVPGLLNTREHDRSGKTRAAGAVKLPALAALDGS